MNERVPASEVTRHWRDFLDRAERGERLIITRGSKDIATLGPVEQRDVTPRLNVARNANAIYDNPNTTAILGAINKKQKPRG